MNATPVILLLASESPAAAVNAGVDVQNVVATATYLVAAALFILALKWLSAPTTARRGNIAGQIGIAAAIVGALLNHHVVRYEWILAGFAIAGRLVDLQMGYGIAQVFDPQTQARVPILSALFGLLAVVFFFLPEGVPTATE